MSENEFNLTPNNLLPKEYIYTTPDTKKGLLGKLITVPNINNIVYTVPDYVTYVNCSLNVLNDSANTVNLVIYVTNKDTPTRVDLIESSDFSIDARGLYLRDNIKLSNKEKLIIYTTSQDLVVRVDGVENIIA